ncbi:hypothetical protein COLO4_21165 [Corchorus olitorius]|uniref:Uncharacterized protein n=1 Tax=Corchorus olitorius TaxID=93759 RepID=A0A1R3IV32_9ROSI|nr:hypothetical protein COLO4_21165 [Corchorus olitorius]
MTVKKRRHRFDHHHQRRQAEEVEGRVLDKTHNQTLTFLDWCPTCSKTTSNPSFQSSQLALLALPHLTTTPKTTSLSPHCYEIHLKN